MRYGIRASSVLLGLVACDAAPDRPPLADFPTALDDVIEDPTINDCQTRTHSFEATTEGYLALELAGYATFDIREGAGDRATLFLRACKRGAQPRSIALNWYGGGELRTGTFDVSREAEEKGGFSFVFVDTTEDAAVTCADSPEGSVTLDKVGAKVVKGSFSVDARCFDDVVLDPDELPNRPALTTFRGTFEASDVVVD